MKGKFKSCPEGRNKNHFPVKSVNPRLRKKLIIISAVFVIVTAAAIIALLAYSNRIVKHKLEQALGPNFTVDRISLSWNSVAINGPRFLKDNQTVASAQSITIKAHFLALLKSGFSISSIVMEQPSFKVEITPEGQWIIPISLPEKESTSKSGPLTIKEIVIKNGTLFYQDHRMPAPNSIEAQKLNASLNDFSYPFKDEPSEFSIQSQLSGKLVSGSVAANGNYNFGSHAYTMKFDGKDLAYFDAGGGSGPILRGRHLTFTAGSENLPAKPLLISDLVLNKPHLRVETDSKGNIKGPFGGPAKKHALQVEVNKFAISDGEILYLDGKISSRPYPVRFTDVNLNADYIAKPSENKLTTYQFSAHIPGDNSTGLLTSTGSTDMKTSDTNAKINLRDLDLSVLKPYIVKKGEADFSKGFLDLDMDLGIKNKNIHAPVHSVIRNLEFTSGSGLKDRFLGAPRSIIVKAMESNNHQIVFDFVLEGNTTNPKSNFRENLIQNLTSGFAKSLGLSAAKAGQTAVKQGGEAIKGVEKEFEGIKEQFKNIFN